MPTKKLRKGTKRVAGTLGKALMSGSYLRRGGKSSGAKFVKPSRSGFKFK